MRRINQPKNNTMPDDTKTPKAKRSNQATGSAAYRYVTYVFDREYDKHPRGNKLPRNMLGEDYAYATPVVWAQGHRMDTLENVLQILRDIREGEIDDPQSHVEKWFNEGEGKTECYW